jgi:hypothetical protein
MSTSNKPDKWERIASQQFMSLDSDIQSDWGDLRDRVNRH